MNAMSLSAPFLRSVLRCAVAAAIAASPAFAQDLVAVKASRILTVSGPVIEDGVVLIQNGRITKVGKQADVEIPWAAKVLDATGKTVMPTWVLAHSQGGMRNFNENMQNVPWLTVGDAVDPASPYFEECLRNGVGAIHVMPGNQTLLAGQADFDRRKAEFDKEKAAGAIPADKKWTEEIDRTKKGAVDLVQKKQKGWLYVPSFAEMDEALRLAQDLDLQVVLGSNIDEGVGLVKKLGKPVVLDDAIEYFETDEETQKEKRFCSAKLLADAGVPFALTLGQGGPTAFPWWQLGTCVRHGIARDKAIEALTMVPAQLIGMGDQLGSLSEGKLGNLQILTGDPLQATSWVETVVLEGQVVYERSKDPRLQYLFEAEKAKASKAAGPDKKETEKKDGEKKDGAEPAKTEPAKADAGKADGGKPDAPKAGEGNGREVR